MSLVTQRHNTPFGSMRTFLLFLLFAAVSEASYRISPTQIGAAEIVWGKSTKMSPNDQPGETNTYRIPLITASPNGSLVVFSEGRKISSSDGGYKFLASRRVLEPASPRGSLLMLPSTTFSIDNGYTFPDGAILGAIVTDTTTGTMFVVYSECDHYCNKSHTYVINSTTDGAFWGLPVEISHQIGTNRQNKLVYSPGPGTGLQKKYGKNINRLVICGHYHDIYTGQDLMWTEGFMCIYSDDKGYNWNRGAVVPGLPYNQSKSTGDFMPNENQPVELPNGDILISIRNQYRFDSSARMFAVSRDGGETMQMESFRVARDLPDPACAAGMVYVPEYDVLLHSNIITTNARVNLTLSWSYDRGKTWDADDRVVVWPEQAAYSCMTLIPGNGNRYVAIAYEQGETNVVEDDEYHQYIALVKYDLNPVKVD